ncbi:MULTISPECIES: flippase [unclassified Coleofasciculus]|uniref:flippase n=1 Tax=unclassified Coleofasciculus TaxID=2692782 RepID=UPI00187F3CCE|nr:MULTISPECIES: flippase [unclassified Coleofasciculus]MBE9126894.1 flippase [Coleofasciculus sp. LEGE 07081]MBE9150210.1 flippase [Coleofasciculus sp. LEGE 07092]
MLDKILAAGQRLSPGLRQILSNLSWLFADKVLELALSLVVGVWVTRYLGPTQFGILTYAITFVAMFRLLSLGGLGSLVVRDLARDPACKEESLGTLFVLQLIGGVITLLVAVSAIFALQPDETLTHWLVGIIAAETLFNGFTTIELWFKSQIQSKYTVFAKKSAYVLMCTVRIALILFKAPLIMFAWARLAEMALAALGLVVVYQIQRNQIQEWRVRWRRAVELLQEGWPLVLSIVAVYIYADIDQLMLGSMLPDKSELGFYAAAVKVSRLLDFFPMVLASSILPKLTQLKEKSSEDYLQKLQIYFDISTLFWLGSAIPVSILSPYIVHSIYGSEFSATSSILSLYVWSQFNSCFGLARNTIITIEGKVHLKLIFTFVGAIINIFLNYLLIPEYGAMGATVATIITYFIAIVLIDFLIKDLRFVGVLIVRSLNLYQAIIRIKKLIQ